MPAFYLFSLAITVALVALACYAGMLLTDCLRYKKSVGSPQGPRRLPLIGNVHQLSTEYMEQTFARWAHEYGDPLLLRFFKTPVLVVNTMHVARKLLDKRGSIYSSRPRTVLFSEMMEWNTIIFLPYDSEHRRKQRKWIQAVFGDHAALKSYDMIRKRETYKLIQALAQDPGNFVLLIKRFVAALLLEITYGYAMKSLEDPYFLLMDEATRGTSDGGAAAALVDFLPFLRFIPTWMPGAGFKRHALKVREIVKEASNKPYQETKAAVIARTAAPSLVATLVEDAMRTGKLQEDERDIISAASSIYGAGSDTTKGTIISFILAMTVYPDVFRKAQAEIDTVLGFERLPELEDRDKLPYIECIVSEVLRWGSAVPLGIPHCVTEDNIYGGHAVPKGTTVLTNIWAMSRDEDVYPDPSEFMPERFLNVDAKARDLTDPRGFVFGFGRRICPGRHFADANIFMAIASIVATLNITKARDSSGRIIEPSTTFDTGLGRHPPEFVCSITPRSQQALDIVSDMLTMVSS